MRAAIDLRRYDAFARVGLSLGATLAALHLILSGVLGSSPPWEVDPNPVDWSYYQTFGRQVAGAAWEIAHQPGPASSRFGLLIGASTMQRGPLPRVVEARTGHPWLLLGIGGGTGAFSKLRRSLPVLSESGLRPDSIVLGVHAIWLCAPPVAVARTGAPLDALWFVRELKPASNAIYSRLQQVRERLFAGSNAGVWAVFPPASRPWDPPPELPYDEPLPESQLEEHRKSNLAAGRFDASSYRPNGEPVRDLVAVVEDLARIQPRITVVLMPEHSKYRTRVPENATRLVTDTLAAVLPASPPRVLDLRASIDDGAFWDNYHLTMAGRRQLSELLGSTMAGERRD